MFSVASDLTSRQMLGALIHTVRLLFVQLKLSNGNLFLFLIYIKTGDFWGLTLVKYLYLSVKEAESRTKRRCVETHLRTVELTSSPLTGDASRRSCLPGTTKRRQVLTTC